MLLIGPDSFQLRFNATTYRIIHPNGARTFSGRACSLKPKLYVVTAAGSPVYVGVTRQRLNSRLRLGWSANGQNGYYGYRWRRELTEAVLHVWYHDDAPTDSPCLDVETVEAEVVYLIRRSGQWPQFQTEIHFHPSTVEHRGHARRILKNIKNARS